MEQTKNRAAGDQPGRMTMLANDGRPEASWGTSATAENAALASVALEEERNPERLIAAAYALSVSPMFVALCRDHAVVMETVDGRQEDRGQSSEQREFGVRLFAARMFLAGLRSRRFA